VESGILVAVWGNIPPNSGLSSSSALVSAALLSVVHANQVSDFIYLTREPFNIIMPFVSSYEMSQVLCHLKK